METKRLLDNAIEYIYELAGEEDWICCELYKKP
jgi:hypothetical protein